MDRVTIFGAGHVGAATAFYLAISAGLDIALVDIEAGKATGLAMDIEQSLPYTGSSSRLEGGADYGLVEGSDLVVVTAGFARMPGMSRTDLTRKNAPIVADICRVAAEKAPEAVVLIVTNPLDEMTFVAWKASGFDPGRVMGMAGVLDTSRFIYFLDRLAGIAPRNVNTMVLGSHGDDMAPLVDWSQSAGKPLSEAVDPDTLSRAVARTRDGGAEIVGHLGTGSAYHAPAVATGTMALAVLGDTGRVLPASVYLSGQYGIEGVFLGVPAKLGRHGVKEVLEMPLSDEELAGLKNAASGISKRISELGAL